MLDREQLARPCKAALDLVSDQHDAVFVTDGAQGLQEGLRCNVEAAFALHGFDHDRRGAMRCDIRLEQGLQRVQRVFFADAVIGHRERRPEDVAGHRPEVVLVRQHLAGHRQGHHGAAVETAVEADDAAAAGGGPRDLDGVFQRLGAGIDQHGLALAARGGDFTQALAELHVGCVRHHRLAGVHDLVELALGGLDHLRVAMPQVQDADTAAEVDEAVAVRVPDLGILRVIGERRRAAGGAGGDVAFLQIVQFRIIHYAAPAVTTACWHVRSCTIAPL